MTPQERAAAIRDEAIRRGLLSPAQERQAADPAPFFSARPPQSPLLQRRVGALHPDDYTGPRREVSPLEKWGVTLSEAIGSYQPYESSRRSEADAIARAEREKLWSPANPNLVTVTAQRPHLMQRAERFRENILKTPDLLAEAAPRTPENLGRAASDIATATPEVIGHLTHEMTTAPARRIAERAAQVEGALAYNDTEGALNAARGSTVDALWQAANFAFGAGDVVVARQMAQRARAAEGVFSPAAPSAARTVEEPTGSIADELLLIGPKTEGESPQLTAYRQMLEEERMAEIAAENAAKTPQPTVGYGHANTLAARRALDEATLRNGGTVTPPRAEPPPFTPVPVRPEGRIDPLNRMRFQASDTPDRGALFPQAGAFSDDITREGNAAQGVPFNPVGARADNDLGPMGRLRATMTPEPRNLPRVPGALADESGAGLETASRQGRTNDNYGNWEPWFDGYTGGGAVPDSELNAANIESLRAQGAFTRQPPMSVSANPRPEVVAEGGAVTPPRPPGELQVHSPAPAAPYENVAMTYATGSPQERMAHVRDIVEQGVARARAEGLSEADAIARGEAEAIEYFRGFQDMRRPGDPFAFINKADIEAIQSGAYKAPASTIETVRPLPGNSGRLAPENPEGIFSPAGPPRGQSPGALDMSTEARMARAKAMGFDTETRLYHGTMKDAGRDAFVPSRGGELGPGIYVTRDPALANDFARSSYGGDYREGAGVLPMYAPRLKEFSGVNEQGLMENGWAVERGKIMDRLRAENGGEWSSDIPMRAEMEMERIARQEGFAGFYVNGRGGMNQGVIFDPSNIRSVHAAFDPAKRDSSDLIASASPNANRAQGGIAAREGALAKPASPSIGNRTRLASEGPEGVFAPAGRQREQNAGIARETSGTQREPLRSERINPWGYDTRAPNGTTAKAIGDYADGKPWDEIARSSGHSSADSAKNNVNLMLRTARARIAAGESPEAVAAAIGTDAATLNRALSTRRPDFRVDTDLDAAIREARKTKTVRETAEDLGVSIGMVQRAERRTRPDTTNVFTPLGFGATAGALALGAGEDAEAATPEETTFNVNPLPAAIRDGRWAGNPIKVPDVSGGYFVRDWTAPDGKTYRVLGQETADSNTLYFGTFEGEFPVARQVDYQGPAVGRQTPFPEGVPPYPFEPAGALAAPERREGYPLERFIGPAVGFAAARFGGPRVVRAVGGSAGDVMIMGRGAIPMAGAAAGGVTQAGLEGRPIEQGALEAAPFMALGPVEAAVRTTALRNMADQINTVSGRAARESAITAAGRQSRDVRAMDAAGAFPEGRDIGPFQVEDRLADFERSLRNRPSPQARVVTDELNANADEFDPDILAYYRNTQPEMLDGTPIPYDPVRSSDVLADTFQAQGWTAGPSGVFSPMQNQVRLMNAEEGARQRGALAIAPPQMEGARPVIPSGASPRPQPLTPGPSVAEPARGALAEEAPAQSMPSPISTDASVFEPTAQTPRAPKRVTPLETRLAKPDGARGDAATAFRGLSTDQLREAARVAGMEAEAAQITTAKELKEKLIPQLVRAARDSEDGASLIRDWRAAGLPLSILISLGIVSAGSGALSEDEPFAPAAR